MPEIIESMPLRGKTMVRDLDIPNVRERNPDPKSGPRLAVKEFRIQGLVEYPELGITREAISKVVEKIRYELMGEGKLLSSGYTSDEISQISDLLVDIEDETRNRHVTPLELQKLVWLIREQRANRGIHLGQIEAIADQITTFYRERGFFLAKAFIPKQDVREGIVTLTLLLGVLGEVDVVGNQLYAKAHIRAVFDDLLIKPVTSSDIEEHLYLVNDFPGLSVEGYFAPGYQVGDSKLNLNVRKEERFNYNLRLDNHGTEETGRYRSYADVQMNNPLGLADRLNLAGLFASSPANTTYWRALYETNVLSPRWKVAISSSTNQYLVDESLSSAPLKVEGEVKQDRLTTRYLFRRGRVGNDSLELGVETVTSDININDSNSNFLDEKVRNTLLTYHFDRLDEKNNILHEGHLKYTLGEFVYGQGGRQNRDFDLFNLDYTYLSFVKVPLFDAGSRLILRTNLQYAGETNLSSIMRFQLGGPSRARAYSPSLFSADDAVYLGLDWAFNSPDFLDITVWDDINLKKTIKPFVFLDYSYGKQQAIAGSLDPTPITARLSNWGLGLQFSHRNRFNGNLMLAFPIKPVASDPEVIPDKPDNRIIFDFQVSF
ncbi:MAG: ShlB/FhaC/HecB family hemolysin secretion/activation protein [Gammaproteobacteria bacterium]|nr:ShlB/FhaC/HecB family hemolysin secretion/activation protein [Gammaproteobacteria bacterium]MDH5652983.1 ShlB/FhaC/HecB family hemolysin secretion/activation protein [Gammaproteobacteria bacterium]